jgi:Flp pilus assembly pilin Flp
MVVGKKHARVVPLAGATLEQMDFTKRSVQGWLADEISKVSRHVVALDDESDKGQGLAEYALLLALISIVAIVALIVLGQQIAAVFDFVGQQIPGNAASPTP